MDKQNIELRSSSWWLPYFFITYVLAMGFAIWIGVSAVDDAITFWLGNENSRSVNVKSLAAIIIGMLGIPFLVWRSDTAFWQAKIAEHQAKTAIANLRLAEKGHNNDRFREGTKLLAEDNVAVASSGVFLLADLVRNADGYFPVVQETLEQYVRKRNIDRSIFKSDSPVPDTAFFLDQSAAIRTLTELRQARDWNSLELLDLANTNMDCVEFNKSKSIHFYNCRLENCSFRELLLPFANFEGAMLRAVDFSGSVLTGANFNRAKLIDSKNVRGTYLNCFGIYLSIKLGLDRELNPEIRQFNDFISAYELAPEEKLNPREQTHALTRIRLHHANSISRILNFQNNAGPATKTYGERLIIPAMSQIADLCQHIPIFSGASVQNASIAEEWSHLLDEDQWATVNVIS
jgi:hypothetical protein